MKKFFAGCFALIILVAFPIVLVSTITIYLVITPSAVKNVIHTSQIGENLPGLIVALAAQQDSSITTTAGLIGTTFSSNDVYSLTDPLVDGVGTWFNTDKPIEQLDLILNITNLKTKLAPAITAQINTSGVQLPTCNGVDTSGVPITSDIGAAIKSACSTDTTSFADEIMKKIPDTVNVKDMLQQQLLKNGTGDQLTLVNQQVTMFRMYWQVLHWIVWIGWIMIGFSLLFIILLRLHPGYAPFGWLAWLDFFKLFELVPLTLVVWLAPQFILPWISGSFDNTVVTVINKAVSALLSSYFWPLVFVTAGVFVSCVFWFIIRGVVKYHITHKTPPPVQTPTAQPAVATTPTTTQSQ